eukprot:TRINITY_DN10628_c1_g1_i2.p4 TRINITY_DN10628_c1_g1~~TRINITY_DN10628_c1_g1_i2.p4  ORF type:complete len:144 (+),score=55.62 TRINITY_DN10628_c1_g1_i2:338-769(+)
MEVPGLSLNGGEQPRQEHRRSVGHIGTSVPKVSKKERMAELFSKGNVGTLVASLVGVLLRDKPNDPIAHMVKHVLSEKEVPDCDDATPYMDAAGKEYLKQHRIVIVIEEFLCGVAAEEPADIPQYAIAWLRWNRQRFAALTCS